MEELQILKDSSEDLKWFILNLNKIKEKFLGDVVAIKSQKVVANGKNMNELLSSLKYKKIDSNNLLIKQVSSGKEIVIF
ncbi:hypothetical protein KAI04_03265 [Candidatus Pacearchaeota archaeon]|nr:hypothetical protein [Candidatus Pacearchaeota archaeon]